MHNYDDLIKGIKVGKESDSNHINFLSSSQKLKMKTQTTFPLFSINKKMKEDEEINSNKPQSSITKVKFMKQIPHKNRKSIEIQIKDSPLIDRKLHFKHVKNKDLEPFSLISCEEEDNEEENEKLDSFKKPLITRKLSRSVKNKDNIVGNNKLIKIRC